MTMKSLQSNFNNDKGATMQGKGQRKEQEKGDKGRGTREGGRGKEDERRDKGRGKGRDK